MAATSYTYAISPPPAVGLVSNLNITFDGNVGADVTFAFTDPGGGSPTNVYSGGSFPDGNTLTVANGTRTGSIRWIPAHSGPIGLVFGITTSTFYPNLTPGPFLLPVVGLGGMSSPVWRQ